METASPGYEAARAGLEAGDVILSWRRGAVAGAAGSPFELRTLEVEQAPRGAVTLEGTRGGGARSWTLGPSGWGLQVRPLRPPRAADAWALGRAAEALVAARKWPEADAAYARALRTATGGAAIALMMDQADAFVRRSDWGAATRVLERAAAEARGGPSLTEALVLLKLGSVAERSGHPDRAEDLYRRSLAIRQAVAPDSLAVAASLHHLGDLAERAGDLARAEDHHRRAYAITARLAPGSFEAARSLNSQGNVAEDRGDLAGAEALYRQALAIEEKLVPGTTLIADILDNLGLIAHSRGDLRGAEGYQVRALAIYERQAPGSLDHAMALHNAGMVAESRHDEVRAEQLFERALAFKEKIAPEGLILASTLNALGNLAWNRGDLAGARRRYERALAIQKRWAGADSPVLATTLFNLAGTARKAGDLPRAAVLLRQSLALREKAGPGSRDVGEALLALGDVLRLQGDWAEAERHYQRALEIIARVVPGSLEHALCLGELARVRRHQGRLEESARLFGQAVDAFEDQVLRFGGTRELRARFRAENADLYSDYAEVLVALDRPRAAFEIVERSRARALLETLAEAQVDARPALEGKLRADTPGQPGPLSAGDIARLLDPDVLLLEYALGEESSRLWAVTRTSLQSYPLAGRRSLEEAARRLYRLVTEQNRTVPAEPLAGRRARLDGAAAELPAAAATLSRLLLAPVAGSLGGRRLLIVADGALHYVPFALLPGPQGLPLLVDHRIAHLPSASVLAPLRRHAARQPPREGLVAVLADPVFAGDDPRVHPGASPMAIAGDGRLLRSAADVGLAAGGRLPRLVFSRREADAIVAVAPAGRALAALDFQASRQTATSPSLGRYRIVHFATHGLLDSAQPELSGLVLSLVDERGRPQDGFLDLQAIYRLELPVDLVVLSGCETALGQEIRGEGLIGLTRGFMYAGASRVLASLWKVDDLATADLMTRFYRALLDRGLPPAEALQRTQLELWRQEGSRPQDWAAFELQGEW